MTTNPFAAPTTPPIPATLRATPTWHRAAWLLPLVGLGLTVMLNAMGRGMGEAGRYLGVFGAVLFIGSVFVGWLLTIGLIFSLLAGRGTLRHFVGGLIANALFTLLLVGAFHASHLARQAAREHQQRQQMQRNLDELENAINRNDPIGPPGSDPTN